MKRPKDRLHRVLVIGATPAGLVAANKLGELGIPVTLVDPDADLDQKLSAEKWRLPSGALLNYAHRSGLLRILRNPAIRCILPGSIQGLKHTPQGFSAKVEKPALFVDPELCVLCGRCMEACPVTKQDGKTPISFAGRRSLPGRALIEKCKRPPCQEACPVGVNAQGYLALAKKGKYFQALELVRRDNVLPGICGRVCSHPCEAVCRRGELDEPLAIRAIKRFVADAAAEERPRIKRAPKRLEKVAVIGSGPAGLAAAADLSRLGYEVTVYEKEKELGGLLRYGIGKHRLPREVLDQDLEYIKQLGVNFVTGHDVDLTVGIKKMQNTFDAVVVAAGAWSDRKLGVPGDDLDGVDGCVDFLSRLYRGEIKKLKEKVAVIGDGNSAFDLARSVKRLGADVTLVSWFPADMLPADEEEIAGATEEGVDIQCRVRVQSFEKKGKKVALNLVETKPGKADANGIRWPVTVKGAEPKAKTFDRAIVAIGQSGPFSEKEKDVCFGITEAGYVDANETSCTSMPGVYAAGDAVTGPTTVVQSLASGREVARAVHKELSGEDMESATSRPHDTEYPAIDSTIPSQSRPIESMLQAQQRIKGFSEVCLGFSEGQVIDESSRCLQCGVCSECLECVDACEAVGAVSHSDAAKIVSEHAGVVILADPNQDPGAHGEDIIRAYGPPAAKTDVHAMMARGFAAAAQAMALLSGPGHKQKGMAVSMQMPEPAFSPDVRVGVFACRCNDSLGWSPEMDGFVEGLTQAPDVDHAETVASACTPEGIEHIVRSIRRKGLTRAVLASCACCSLDFICSACTDQRTRLKDGLFKGTGVSRSMVETVNLRGEALTVFSKDEERGMDLFTGLLTRAVKRARNLKPLPALTRSYNFTTAVVGTSEAALTSAKTMADAGLDVFLFGDKNKPLPEVEYHPNIHAFEGSQVKTITGALGDFTVVMEIKGQPRPLQVGTVVLGPDSAKTVPYIHQEELADRDVQKKMQKQGRTGRAFLFPGATSVAGLFVASPLGLNVSERKKGAGAAALAAAVMPRGPRQSKGYTVVVDNDRCRGCAHCYFVCPYQAVTMAKNGVGGWSAVVDEALCKGCGNCITVCPSGAADSPYRNHEFLENILEEVLN